MSIVPFSYRSHYYPSYYSHYGGHHYDYCSPSYYSSWGCGYGYPSSYCWW